MRRPSPVFPSRQKNFLSWLGEISPLWKRICLWIKRFTRSSARLVPAVGGSINDENTGRRNRDRGALSGYRCHGGCLVRQLRPLLRGSTFRSFSVFGLRLPANAHFRLPVAGGGIPRQVREACPVWPKDHCPGRTLGIRKPPQDRISYPGFSHG